MNKPETDVRSIPSQNHYEEKDVDTSQNDLQSIPIINQKDNLGDTIHSDKGGDNIQSDKVSTLNQKDNTIHSDKVPILAQKEPLHSIPIENLKDNFVGVDHLPLGKITIGHKLGSGAWGDVFCANWEDRKVALKKIDLPSACIKFKITMDEAKESLQWEISRISTVNHPNLVYLYGIYQHPNEDYIYLVMELCSCTLEDILTKGNVPWSKRWMWSLQITEALSYLHNEGVMHRDLKTENILIDSEERAKLADLGVSQIDVLLESNE